MLAVLVLHLDADPAQAVVAAQARVFVQRILARQRHALDPVMRPLALQPLHGLSQQETAQATVQGFQLQTGFRANAYQAFAMVNADVQAVLFLVHLLARQPYFHAQQAVGLVVALGIAELHKAQRPCAGAAVGGQGGQA